MYMTHKSSVLTNCMIQSAQTSGEPEPFGSSEGQLGVEDDARRRELCRSHYHLVTRLVFETRPNLNMTQYQ